MLLECFSTIAAMSLAPSAFVFSTQCYTNCIAPCGLHVSVQFCQCFHKLLDTTSLYLRWCWFRCGRCDTHVPETCRIKTIHKTFTSTSQAIWVVNNLDGNSMAIAQHKVWHLLYHLPQPGTKLSKLKSKR